MSDHRADETGRQQRQAEFLARFDAGEFDASMALTDEAVVSREQLDAGQRADFLVYGWAARVAHDPATDFAAFLEDLWVQVSSRFKLTSASRWSAEADAETPVVAMDEMVVAELRARSTRPDAD